MYKAGDDVDVEIDGVWRQGVVTVVTESGLVGGEAKVVMDFVVYPDERKERLRLRPEPSFNGDYCRACDEGDPCKKHPVVAE